VYRKYHETYRAWRDFSPEVFVPAGRGHDESVADHVPRIVVHQHPPVRPRRWRRSPRRRPRPADIPLEGHRLDQEAMSWRRRDPPAARRQKAPAPTRSSNRANRPLRPTRYPSATGCSRPACARLEAPMGDGFRHCWGIARRRRCASACSWDHCTAAARSAVAVHLLNRCDPSVGRRAHGAAAPARVRSWSDADHSRIASSPIGRYLAGFRGRESTF